MRRVLLSWLVLVATSRVAWAQNPAVAVDVDNAAQRHAIDPRVYGVAFGDATQLADLNCPLNRLGGTHSSRYNWNVNAYNRGDDYYFESIVENGDLTPGATADAFIDASKAAGAEPMMTIPMVGWVAKVGPNGETTCSFPTATYPNQQFVDAGAGCGNGISSAADNPPIAGNDPNVADVPADQTFQQTWVQHIIGRSGTAANGGLRYYLYDNEPSIWHASHRDVHPSGAGMDEVRDKSLAYGAMIKAQDPDAVLVGPEEWGWDGYFNSGIDLKYYNDVCAGQQGPCVFPDRAAHGGMDYLPWFLDQMYQHEVNTGQRLLDVFAVHFYPQGDQAGHQEFGNDVSTATQLLRNVSTRSLWDPAYVDQSYIQFEGIDGGVIQLVPRLKGWANTYYPGIQVGLTEYNWGAENHMNGATTQADILGILGREGLDLATRWEMPPTGSPVYNAFKMYRNYDGANSAFGDVSVSASAPNPDHVAAFAAQRSSDNALTVMLISKYLSGTTSTTVNLANFAAGAPAQVWRLAANTMSRLADVAVNAGSLTLTLPAQSVTLLVLPEGPVLSVADTRAPEPASGTTTAVFTVTLSSASNQAVSVDYATANGTATAGPDYLASAGTLTFDPGVTTQTVGVTILADGLKETNETVTVTLSGPVGATLDRAQATGTIVDNALVPKLQFSLPAYLVGEAGVRAAISVRRIGSLVGTVGVSYAAYDGTATAPADYASTAGTLSFPSGVAVRTFLVPIVNDTLTETDETVLLRLSDPTGGALLGTQPTAVLTIRDNDPAGTFSLYPAALRLSEAAGLAKLSVRRTGGAYGTVTVDYGTVDGSALAGADYTGQAGTLTFTPGQTAQSISVPIAADGVPEGEEFFQVTLANPTGGSKLGTTLRSTVTITSADLAVEFLSPTYLVSEAALQATISVKRTGSLAQPLMVTFATADGTAVAGTDYTATGGVLTFPAGVAVRSFPVKLLLHDTVYRPTRTVNLSLSAPSAGVRGTSQAVLTIRDDDVPGTVQFAASDLTVSEGAGTATVRVTRTGNLAAGQTVVLSTTDGTALAGTNYQDASQTLTFAAFESFKLVTIPVLDDGNPGGGAVDVHLTLGSPDGGARVGPRGAATLWIVENR